MSIDWAPFKKLVEECESFALTSHTRADCDAIGSELAMALVLESLGKRVRILNADAPPPHIAFLDSNERIEVFGSDFSVEDAHAVDAHLVLDTSAWGQLGEMAGVIDDSPARRAVIDHHVSGDDLGAEVFKDAEAEATGRLVLEALDALGAELTAEIALPLFAAIATDTGWFRFPSVSEGTYTAVARLVAAGVRPNELFSQLYDRNTPARIRLHGRVMESLSLHHDNRVATGRATAADFSETGAALSDTEDVVNRLLSVEGVEAAILFADMEPGLVKVSLRSRSQIDVRAVAERFGGGGHTKAAGVRFRGTIDDAQQAVLETLAAQLG